MLNDKNAKANKQDMQTVYEIQYMNLKKMRQTANHIQCLQILEEKYENIKMENMQILGPK